MSGRRVAGAIRSLVNARDLQFECGVIKDSVYYRKRRGKEEGQKDK